jgi:hypothetical protein
MNHLLSSLSGLLLFSQAWFNPFEFLVVTLARGFLLHVSPSLEMGRSSCSCGYRKNVRREIHLISKRQEYTKKLIRANQHGLIDVIAMWSQVTAGPCLLSLSLSWRTFVNKHDPPPLQLFSSSFARFDETANRTHPPISSPLFLPGRPNTRRETHGSKNTAFSSLSCWNSRPRRLTLRIALD